MGISCDGPLKDVFEAARLLQIWLFGKDYQNISGKTWKILLPFVTIYLCETVFSVVAVMKTKYLS
jgi:hypothetical protein